MLTKTSGAGLDQSAIDRAMMERCIRHSAIAGQRGELPFATLICDGGEVVVETTNQVAEFGDVTRHAELVAISQAQKVLGRKNLSGCTLYTNVEPCPMCSFPIRETRISRVVFAIGSPMMGGLSRWNVLRDRQLSQVMPEVFGPVPEVIAGLARHEAEKVWRGWNPMIWAAIKYRGCFGHDNVPADVRYLDAIPERAGLLRRLFVRRRKHRSG